MYIASTGELGAYSVAISKTLPHPCSHIGTPCESKRVGWSQGRNSIPCGFTSGPVSGTGVITPVHGSSSPRKLAGKPEAGHVLGALFSSHGVSATSTEPGRNRPVIRLTVSLPRPSRYAQRWLGRPSKCWAMWLSASSWEIGAERAVRASRKRSTQISLGAREAPATAQRARRSPHLESTRRDRGRPRSQR